MPMAIAKTAVIFFMIYLVVMMEPVMCRCALIDALKEVQ